MAIGRIPEPGTGIPESIVDAKGDIVTATAADTPARIAVGANETRLVADSAAATGLKYVADTTNYAVAAKGDLLVGTAADTVAPLTVGANGTTLVADSAEATGLKWATAASGGMTLINTGGTTLTGASVTISSIPATYKSLKLVVENFKPATNAANLAVRLNNTTSGYAPINTDEGDNQSFGNDQWRLQRNQNSTTSYSLSVMDIYGYANTGTWKTSFVVGFSNASGNAAQYSYSIGAQVYDDTSAVTSVVILPSTGNFTSGTAYLYGVS